MSQNFQTAVNESVFNSENNDKSLLFAEMEQAIQKAQTTFSNIKRKWEDEACIWQQRQSQLQDQLQLSPQTMDETSNNKQVYDQHLLFDDMMNTLNSFKQRGFHSLKDTVQIKSSYLLQALFARTHTFNLHEGSENEGSENEGNNQSKKRHSEHVLKYLIINDKVFIHAGDMIQSFDCIPLISNIRNELQFTGIDAEEYAFGKLGFYLHKAAWMHYWIKMCDHYNVQTLSKHDVSLLYEISRLFSL